MKLFKYEGYNLKVSEEALMLKPFKDLWKRDKSKNKDQETKKLKSKFNLLEQGRLMSIGNIEEVSKNIIIVGPKGSGKSSIFSLLTTGSPYSYSDNGTCGINFGFMRSQSSIHKKVINVYEIGADIDNIILIKTLLNNDNFESTIILIILDFENPNSQLSKLLKLLNELKKIISEIIDVNNIENNIKSRISFYSSNKKPDDVEVFPLETYVICNKYDLIETIDIEKLKWLCPSLRYFCFTNALHLIYYSLKKIVSTKKYKKIIEEEINFAIKIGPEKHLETLFTKRKKPMKQKVKNKLDFEKIMQFKAYFTFII